MLIPFAICFLFMLLPIGMPPHVACCSCSQQQCVSTVSITYYIYLIYIYISQLIAPICSNRSPKSEKKSRTRRSQVNSLCLDEQSKYPLFGARLNALELNMSDHPYVPRFVVDVCAHIERADCIEQDGIYRASGNKLLVDELKRKLTHLYDPRCLQTDDIHTLTSLHKQFFRELPAPLITQEAYERLGRCLTDDAAIERMRLAFDEMPEPNRSTLRFLIKHLTK